MRGVSVSLLKPTIAEVSRVNLLQARAQGRVADMATGAGSTACAPTQIAPFGRRSALCQIRRLPPDGTKRASLREFGVDCPVMTAEHAAKSFALRSLKQRYVLGTVKKLMSFIASYLHTE